MRPSTLREKVHLQYCFDRSEYAVAPGGRVAVTVAIREILNTRSGGALLAPGADGLIGGGVLVLVTAPHPSRPARVRSIADIKGNSRFDFTHMPQPPEPTRPNAAGMLALSTNPVFGEKVARCGSIETVQLPLASFLFTAGSVLGEVTHLMAINAEVDPRTTAGNNLTASGIVLDGLLRPDVATITVTPRSAVAESPEDESSLADTDDPSGQRSWRRRC